MRRILLAMLTVVSSFIISCAGDAPDDCAFQAQDGTCAVVVSSSGALECTFNNAALCSTMTAFLDGDEPTVGSTTAALMNTGGGTSLYCEPDGTFMCTCCSVKAGCYPCPTKPKGSILLSGEVVDTSSRASGLEASGARFEAKAP